MNLDAIRQQANDAIAHATSMNASSEHPPSKDKATFAALVLSLCDALEAAHAEIAALKAAQSEPPEIVAPAKRKGRAGAASE